MTGFKDDSGKAEEDDIMVSLDCAHIIPHFLGEVSRTAQEVRAIS
jgi:hypothetical protein